MDKTRVLLIDDHPMMIEGLKCSLADAENIQVDGVALTAAEALEFLRHHPVDIVITDIDLPDINGLEICKQIKASFPQVKVLAFTEINQYQYISEMLQNGACGYMLKNITRQQLMDAIHAAKANKKYFSAEVTETLLQHSMQPASPVPKLTSREKEVLQLIAQGFTNQEIAEKLFISILTVISHRKNLMAKFEAVNTATLINIAGKHGFV
jgi:DNA-binding NarL/FixJ family response regulator